MEWDSFAAGLEVAVDRIGLKRMRILYLEGIKEDSHLDVGKLGKELAEGFVETPAVAGVEGTVIGVAGTPPAFELSGGPIRVSTSTAYILIINQNK